jgi:hypothetical protein
MMAQNPRESDRSARVAISSLLKMSLSFRIGPESVSPKKWLICMVDVEYTLREVR